MSLRVKAITGVKWTTISSIVGIVVQLAQVAILARFLSAGDLGLMALALIVIGFSQLFIDMGISSAIIHKQQIEKHQLDSLFWLNVWLGWLMFGLIVLAAPLIAQFYHQPALSKIIIIIGLSFIIQPFEQQFLTIMRKELLFHEIAKRDIISKLVSFVVAVILAWQGYGIYALVIAYLASVAVSVVLVIITGIKYHKPGLYFKLKDLKGFFSFGMFQTGSSIVNYFNYQVDDLLVGKLLGLELLGIYTIAKNIVMRPTQIINPIVTQVSFPLMAKVQHEQDVLKRVYLRSINYLSAINFQIYVYIMVAAPVIITLLFGPKWLPAVLILKILSVYAMIRSVLNPVGSLLLAKGWSKRSFYWNIAILLFVPLFVWIGGEVWGLAGVAVMLLLLFVLLLIPAWRFLVYPACKVNLGEYLGQLIRPALVALCLFGILSLANQVPIQQAVMKLAFLGVIFLTAALPLNKFLNNSFFTELLTAVKGKAAA